MKTLALLLALLTAAPALAEPALVFSFITEKIEFGPGDLVEAEAGISHSEPFPAINFRMSAAKSVEFEAMSGRHVGDPMDILVCGRLISSPVIREPIRGGSDRSTANSPRMKPWNSPRGSEPAPAPGCERGGRGAARAGPRLETSARTRMMARSTPLWSRRSASIQRPALLCALTAAPPWHKLLGF